MVRRDFKHLACGRVTTMDMALAVRYAEDPKQPSAIIACAHCGCLVPVLSGATWNLEWVDDGEPVGSTAEEAAAYLSLNRFIAERGAAG